MHTIRLRGPWQIQPVKRFVRQSDGLYQSVADELPVTVEAKMPADWGEAMGAGFLGVVRYRRNFNRPTNLEPHERVWLVLEPPRSCGRLDVNGREFGSVRFCTAAGRFDITGLLEDHNSVVIDVVHPELDDEGHALDESSVFVPGGLVGEVRLEIQETL